MPARSAGWRIFVEAGAVAVRSAPCSQLKLPLSERTYRCGSCGLVLDRDVNAAINLRDLAASGPERLSACGGCVRPGRAGRRPLNQEPGTAHAGKTRGRRPVTGGCGMAYDD